MESITAKNGTKRLKTLSHVMLAAIAVLALGLWSPRVASATLIAKSEPNDTGATAQDVNGSFSLDFDVNINDDGNINTSTSIPHVSISAIGNDTVDFYFFSSDGGTLILDIDETIDGGAFSDADTLIALWNATSGVLLLSNDDPLFTDTGSSDGIGCLTTCNSFLQAAISAGDYIVGVCRVACGFENDFGITPGSDFISSNGFYTLHISTPHETSAPAPAPEPSALILLGSGLAGLAVYRRRRKG